MSDPSGDMIRELVNAGYSVDEIAGLIGLGPELGAKVEAFKQSPLERLMMSIARRGPMPQSEAWHRWQSDDDVVAEFAWDIWQGLDQASRCPACGLDHDEVRDDRGRPLPDGPVKLKRVDCWVELERERAIENRISEEDRKAGVTYKVTPRNPGDKWIDDEPF